MTLAEKQALMRAEVAVPSVAEYQFLGADRELKNLLADAVNKILLDALAEAQSREIITYGEIARLVYRPLGELQKRYAAIGVCDSETYYAIARFWGLNYDPAIYDFMRYPPEDVINTDKFP